MAEKICFNKKIYTQKAIKNTIDAFHHAAHFRVSSDKKYHIVSVDKIDADIKDVLTDEFCDFAMVELKKEGISS